MFDDTDDARPSLDRAPGPVGRVSLALTTVAALLVAPGAASGQGFGIYEQGSCVMGRAGAGVADPCGDGSTMYFNPAGLTYLDGVTVSAGLTGIETQGDFNPDGPGESATNLDNRLIPVPHGYVGFALNERWSFGVGAFAPYGLETSWPLDFDGRFSGYDNALRSVYVQPTAAWRPVDGLSVGVGPTVVWSEVELNQRLDLARAPVPGAGGASFGELLGPLVPSGTDYADAALEGSSDGIDVGFHAGALLEVTPTVRAGARYMSQVEVAYDGEAVFEPVETGISLPADNPFDAPAGTPVGAVLQNAGAFSPGGALADQGLSTEITLPDQLVLGLAWDATERLTLSGDWQWTQWSDFDRIVLDFEKPATPDEVRVEDYENTNGFRLGADYELPSGVALRGGYVYNQAAAPDETVTPLLPEAQRSTVTAGVGWESDGGLGLDVGYMYLGQDDRRGRLREPPAGAPTTALNSGVYSFNAHLFGASVTVDF